MKNTGLIGIFIFAVCALRAQQVQIHNATGQSLDSLTARYNQKVVDYKDPADNADFKAQNNCTACKHDTSVFTCTKTASTVTYKFFGCHHEMKEA
ncbi:MAG: hypothetical protein JNK66_08100 [Chitinophagales bacterium]|nr:hypothetical protein [Chitinophagales bacterium]